MRRKLSVHARCDPETLRRLYIEERKTIQEVAQVLQVSRSTVLAAMMYWRIPRRSGGIGKQLQWSEADIDKLALQRLYVEERRTISDIARELHLTTRGVRKALIHFQIPAYRGRKRREKKTPPPMQGA